MRFAKALTKWFLSCLSLIIFYAIFGDVGILFGVGLSYVIIYYW